jgi:hypothetical protein
VQIRGIIRALRKSKCVSCTTYSPGQSTSDRCWSIIQRAYSSYNENRLPKIPLTRLLCAASRKIQVRRRTGSTTAVEPCMAVIKYTCCSPGGRPFCGIGWTVTTVL